MYISVGRRLLQALVSSVWRHTFLLRSAGIGAFRECVRFINFEKEFFKTWNILTLEMIIFMINNVSLLNLNKFCCHLMQFTFFVCLL